MKTNSFLIRFLTLIVVIALFYLARNSTETAKAERQIRQQQEYQQSLYDRDFNERLNQRLMKQYGGGNPSIEEANSMWYTKEEYKKRFRKYPNQTKKIKE